MNGLGSLARSVWEQRGLLERLLWILFLPLSFFYFLAVLLRNFLYSVAYLRSRELPCPVVSVGNLTVGGTGKTPTTLWLAQELAERGYSVAILSRGYKGKSSAPRILEPGFNQFEAALSVGDESLIMAGIYGQKVGVGKKRYEVAKQLLSGCEVDVLLLDDGFQHRRLRRDLDLLLLGEDWKGWTLPAGPFREPRGALRRAHYFLITGAREKWQAILARDPELSEGFYGSLEANGLLARDDNRWVEVPLATMSGSKILAVSGIANAAPFYRMIQEWGGDIVDTVEYPDHHDYSAKDWQEISRAGRHADRVITTEKDMVKLVQFPFAKDRLYALRVMMVVEKGDKLVDAVEETLRAKRDGHDRGKPPDG